MWGSDKGTNKISHLRKELHASLQENKAFLSDYFLECCSPMTIPSTWSPSEGFRRQTEPYFSAGLWLAVATILQLLNNKIPAPALAKVVSPPNSGHLGQLMKAPAIKDGWLPLPVAVNPAGDFQYRPHILPANTRLVTAGMSLFRPTLQLSFLLHINQTRLG